MSETPPNPEEIIAGENRIIEMDIEGYDNPKPEITDDEKPPEELPNEPPRPEDTPEPGLEIPVEKPEIERKPNIVEIESVLEKIKKEEDEERERNQRIDEISKRVKN